MKDPLTQHIQRFVPIETEVISKVREKFFFEKVAKNETLINAGSINKNFFILTKGYARAFHIDSSGVETTTEIFVQGDLACSMYCILNNQPSYETIQCITDCEFFRISEDDFTNLYNQDPQWMVLGMKILKFIQLKKEERIARLLKHNATERYLDIIETHPDYVSHVPVQYLSSYLGIKPESLSRIRRQVLRS